MEEDVSIFQVTKEADEQTVQQASKCYSKLEKLHEDCLVDAGGLVTVIQRYERG
jgi:hypothetical protein